MRAPDFHDYSTWVSPYPTPEGIFEDLVKRVPAARNANSKKFVDTRFIKEAGQGRYIDGLYR